jgi:cysteine desulfurase
MKPMTARASAVTTFPVYLDCNATTPIEPRVAAAVMRYMEHDFGNAGSRTHEYGSVAKEAVSRARSQVAAVVDASAEEVIFTSGATESNNLAILGIAKHAEGAGRRHLITTAIEHKAVLEPLEYLASNGLEITYLSPNSGGWVEPEQLRAALRQETSLVSIMHVNNETGVIQPVHEYARVLADHEAFFHVDAAQGYGKRIEDLREGRIDLISISGHKLYAPKGIGALVARRRGFRKPPLTPLMFGGGQERGLRPGTLPVHLIVGLGAASQIALDEHAARSTACEEIKSSLRSSFERIGAIVNGDPSRTVNHVLNVSLRGIDSEAAILALKRIVAISNGSACTSSNYQASHVLTAMGLPESIVRSALRLSWCHLTPRFDVDSVTATLRSLV